MLNHKIKEKYGFDLPINNLYLDTGVRDATNGLDKIIPIKEYLEGKDTETQDSKKIPHFMDAEEKRNDKEMGQYLKNRTKINQII